MPLRRSLLTALCLAIFGTVPTVAQEKDPFADWDRVPAQSQKSRSAAQQKRPSIGEVSAAVDKSTKDKSDAAKPADKANVKYFSAAQTAPPTGDSTKPKPATAIPMREKTQTRLAVEPHRAEAQTAMSEKPAVTRSSGEAASMDISKESSGKISTVAMLTEESRQPRSPGIRNADFSNNGEPAAKKAIRSVADSSEVMEDGSSFEEFLGTTEPATATQAPGFDFGSESEEESAEPLLDRQTTASDSPVANLAAEPQTNSTPKPAEIGVAAPAMTGTVGCFTF